MIREKVWRFFTKIFSGQPFCPGNKQGEKRFFKLFVRFSGIRFPVCYGDVKRLPRDYAEKYARKYAPHLPCASGEIPVFPVENQNFSTFSTDFSTGVFHRDLAQNYAACVNIIIFGTDLLFSTFSLVGIFTIPEFCPEKKDLTLFFLNFLKKTTLFFILGIDFIAQARYNA